MVLSTGNGSLNAETYTQTEAQDNERKTHTNKKEMHTLQKKIHRRVCSGADFIQVNTRVQTKQMEDLYGMMRGLNDTEKTRTNDRCIDECLD